MAKQLFHEDGWDAEAALRCAQVAQGDWRKLRSTAEIFRHGNELTADTDLVESSRTDATMSALHPSLAANQLLDGPEGHEEDVVQEFLKFDVQEL